MGRAIWLVVGTPCQMVSGVGMVTRLPAAVPLQNLLGPGRFIWFVAIEGGGVIGAVRVPLVAYACAEAAALDRAGNPAPDLCIGPGARYCPTAGVPCRVRRVACPATIDGVSGGGR